MKYDILWIDDEHEKLGNIHMTAQDHGVKLCPFKSFEGGIGELEKNYPYYDGVLLDAKFFQSEDDEAGSEDLNALNRARERVLQLPKKFELFILTGQAQLFEDETFNTLFPKYYRKGIDKDIDRLFKDLKSAAKNQEDTQIRHRYQRVFDVCTEKYIGEYASKDLLSILKEVDKMNIDNHFNTIRKIIEDIFIAFNKYNLLPKEFITPSVALNESSKFLSGKFIEKGFQHNEGTHLPDQINDNLKSILSITQAGSHRSKIDEHIKILGTPYLLKSVLYQLVDIIIWFKIYVDSKPKTENWTKVENNDAVSKELVSGKVINLNPQKGYAFLKPDDSSENIFIPPHIIESNQLQEGMDILAEAEEYVDNRTNEQRKRVKRIGGK